ncbi:MAG: M23 family metallopeptidase [Clostridia bacterium]|nr:M23 family metallopeptidase [Clostridia bacterium]
MNFILRNWVKYYTKEAIKTLKLVTIGSAIVITVVCVKYRPAYKVTISGETIGYVENRDLIEKKIDKYINNTSGNIAFREISNLPEYEFKLVNREKELRDKDVMLAVENLTTTTYRFFAVTSEGEQKAVVSSQEEAESVINEIKADLNKDVDLKLGIVEVYTTDTNVSTKEAATNTLNEIKIAKVTEYEKKKAEEAKKKAAAAARARSFASTATVAPTGNLNGLALAIPVNGSISSRFGSRGGSRSSVHTGLDISTSSGTGIRPIAAGTVTYAGYRGSYGNLLIIDHGNGVQSYYAHCSALYVSAGQAVGAGTTIAAVGSTGNSTGPHLHLEIRVNGTPVNPQSYIY